MPEVRDRHAQRTADLFCAICNQFQPMFLAGLERQRAMRGPEPEGNPLLEPAEE